MKTTFSQDNRLLQLVGPDQDARLTLVGFSGSESLSTDFEFTLDCVSDVQDIAAAEWQGKAATVIVRLPDQGERFFNGVVKQFLPGNADYQGHYSYRLILAPWFSALALTQNCRIFQQKTVVQIVQILCQEFNFVDLDVSQLGNDYTPLNYCVQYNETTHQFCHRILAEQAIFYTYQHERDRHVLTLLDSASPITANSPTYTLDATTQLPLIDHWQHNTTAEQQAEHMGHSNLVSLSPNQYFTLSNQQTSLGDFYITRIQHEAHDNTHRQQRDTDTAQHYSNQLSACSAEQTFTPIQLLCPELTGPQSAIVVGPAGQKIYTDEFGRIKVQFMWDRVGKQDEQSSCWLPVTQWQVGDEFGTQFMPRIGDEVIVDFIDGDMEQPIVIGSAYHAEHPPIFASDDPSSV
ncbi:MAG: type VI secretion system tip protein VgrG, partial [Gammaproteobacteria bacterium]|nr:type VI secretion system tip protein VgrG [Gammaproteobacteria bacterium]